MRELWELTQKFCRNEDVEAVFLAVNIVCWTAGTLLAGLAFCLITGTAVLALPDKADVCRHLYGSDRRPGRRDRIFIPQKSTVVFTAELVPIRLHPAWIKASKSSRVRIPPAALILTEEPMCSLNNKMSSIVAPAVPKPVEVFYIVSSGFCDDLTEPDFFRLWSDSRSPRSPLRSGCLRFSLRAADLLVHFFKIPVFHISQVDHHVQFVRPVPESGPGFADFDLCRIVAKRKADDSTDGKFRSKSFPLLF